MDTITCTYTATATGALSPAQIKALIDKSNVPVDDAWLKRWGLRSPSSLDNTVLGPGMSQCTRTIQLKMGPSSVATVTGAPTSAVAPSPCGPLTVTGAGLDYLFVPQLVITDPIGIGSGADAQATLGVFGVQGIDGGGYSTQTTVTAVGGALAPGGVQATFSVAIALGAVVPTILTNGGPYNKVPTLVVNDPTGAGGGAAFTARLGLSGAVLGFAGAAYSAVSVAVVDYFHTIMPDSVGTTVQASCVGNFMRSVIEAATGIVCAAGIPVVSTSGGGPGP